MLNRTPRHNLDAEAAILGAIILRSDEVLAQLDTLETEDFYSHHHKVVFEAIRNLEAADQAIDVVTLEAEIEKTERLDAVGGIAFLGELALRVPTLDNVLEYSKIVQDHAKARRLGVIAMDIVDRSYDPDFEVDEQLERAMAEIGRVDRFKRETAATIGTLAKRRLRDIEELASKTNAGEVALSGLPTGIESLDRRIGGWQFGVINMIAARPAMGKSAAAIATADACTGAGHGVHVFSIEDSWATYADRCISRRSKIATEQLRRGAIEGGQAAALVAAVGSLVRRERWLIDDRKSLSASEVIRAVRREKKRNNTRCVIVDYVHLVRKNRRLEEHEAISEIMDEFAQAIEPDEVWLVLAQLNRKLEDRADKRPTLSDLRGSGSLEEKAKMIVGLYRGSYYGGKPKPTIDYDCACESDIHLCRAPSLEEWERQVKCCVIKNSNGAPCDVFANWHGPTTEIW